MAKVTDPHLLKHKQEVLQEETQPLQGEKPVEQTPPDDERAEHELVRLSQKSSDVLLQIHTVFPFDLFPNTLSVDAIKINYKNNILFSSGYTESIAISDINNVTIESAVLFSTLSIYFSAPTRELHIKPLWKKDAEKARDIIAGLIFTAKQHIDVDVTPPEEKTIETVGETHT